MEIFNELARIFSEDNNAWAQREVLMREGTAKFADTAGENDRHLQKVFQRQVCILKLLHVAQLTNQNSSTTEHTYQPWNDTISGHIFN